MRQVNLVEHETTSEIALSAAERDAIRAWLPSVGMAPTAGTTGAYDLTPGSVVGALELDDLSVSIRPKLPVKRLLFLLSYALDRIDVREEEFHFADAPLVETVVAVFTAAARSAFRRGLLQGYRTVWEPLRTVRGRIHIDEQIRRRFGMSVPIEVSFDDFTADITPNRLVKAAVIRLARMRVRSTRYRAELQRIASVLSDVALVEYRPTAVPPVAFDRLNNHYRSVVGLARLVLRHAAFDQGRGTVRAAGFLIDMNRAFEDFVVRAVREELGVSAQVLRSGASLPRRITLDQADRVRLVPDLSWWDGEDCTFVCDAKYKRTRNGAVPNADLYQMLAYVTALDLPNGLLIYAAGESEPAVHRVRYADKLIEVRALDLSGPLEALRARLREIGQRIVGLRAGELADHAA